MNQQNQNNANPEVTLTEVMEFLQENVATKDDLKVNTEEVKKEMRQMEHRILDGVDKKLENLKADLVVLTRKEDRKVVELISLLRDKTFLTKEEAARLLGMEPFPQPSL